MSTFDAIVRLIYVAAAAGFVLGGVTAIGGTNASGFNVTLAGNVVQFRAKSSSQAL